MTLHSSHVPKRSDAAKILVGLVGVIVVAWLYLLAGAGIEMQKMDMGGGQMMLMPPTWTPRYAALVFLMWVIMMAAMMLPSAAPAILLAARLPNQRLDKVSGTQPAVLFTAGYLMAWTGFSFTATLLQWALDRAGLLSGAMATRGALAAGAFLLAAGIYQVTPLKRSCLLHCRSPICFAGNQGYRAWAVVRQGMRYGVSCLGCCSVLMGLLFVGGLMNVWWVAVLALLVLAEKTLRWGSRMTRFTGAALIAWGSISLIVGMF